MSRLISFPKEPIIRGSISIRRIPDAARRAYLWAMVGAANTVIGADYIRDGAVLWGALAVVVAIVCGLVVAHHAALIEVAVARHQDDAWDE